MFQTLFPADTARSGRAEIPLSALDGFGGGIQELHEHPVACANLTRREFFRGCLGRYRFSAHRHDLVGACQNTFTEEKSGGQFVVVSGGAHGDDQGPVPDPNLQRGLDGNEVRYGGAVPLAHGDRAGTVGGRGRQRRGHVPILCEQRTSDPSPFLLPSFAKRQRRGIQQFGWYSLEERF